MIELNWTLGYGDAAKWRPHLQNSPFRAGLQAPAPKRVRCSGLRNREAIPYQRASRNGAFDKNAFPAVPETTGRRITCKSVSSFWKSARVEFLEQTLDGLFRAPGGSLGRCRNILPEF